MATERRRGPFLSPSLFSCHALWPNFGRGGSASRSLRFYLLDFILGVTLCFIRQALQDLNIVQVFNQKRLSFETTAANKAVGMFANY